MDKDSFLKNLTEDLKPVEPIKTPQQRLMIWSSLSLLFVLAVMLFIQPFRPGFGSQLQEKHFLLETIFSFLPFFSLGLVTFLLSVPGLRVSRGLLILASSPFLLFLASLAYGYMGHPSLAPSMAGKRPYCFYEVLTLSWFPILLMVYFVRRAHAFVSPRLSFAIGLAGSTLPMAMMQVACMHDPYHILSHHVFAAAIVTVVMSVFGFYLLRRK